MPVRKLQSYEVDYQEELHQQVPRYQDYTPEEQSDYQSQGNPIFC